MKHAEIAPAVVDGRGLRVAMVATRWNASVIEVLVNGAHRALRECGVAEDDIHLVMVSGALEIPLALAALAQREQYDALVALGCVIRGDTYHFEIVANECNAGISRVQLDYTLPVGNGVLTVNNEAQAEARMAEKGADAARVALEMARLLKQLRRPA